MNLSFNLTESLNNLKNENVKLFKESMNDKVVSLTLLNSYPDDNFRIYYKGDDGNLYCDMFGTLYICTEEGEPDSPVVNMDKFVISGSVNESSSEEDTYSKIIKDNFDGEGTYNLQFNGNDETQYDAKTFGDLLELWLDFCAENDLNPNVLENVEKTEDIDESCKPVKESTESMVVKVHSLIDNAKSADDIISAIGCIDDSDLQSQCYSALKSADSDDLDSVKDAVISALEDNAVYEGEIDGRGSVGLGESDADSVEPDEVNILKDKRDKLEARLGDIISSLRDMQMDSDEFRELAHEAAKIDAQISSIDEELKNLNESDISDMSKYSDLEDVDVDSLKKLQSDALSIVKRAVDYVYYEAPYSGIADEILNDMIALIKQSLPKMNESEDTDVPYDNTTEKVCPKCHKKYTDYPALSRRDNKTYICPDCGVREALEDYYGSIKESAKGTDTKSPISEAEISGKTLLKNQGNVYMFECKGNSDFTHIVGENYNEEENTLENVETYKNKEDADKDYLGRCDIKTGDSLKANVDESAKRDIEDGLDESEDTNAGSITEDFNTGVLPIVDVNMYPLDDILSRYDVSGEELDKIIMDLAPKYIKDTLDDVLPNVTVTAKSVYHPKEYNFYGDELEFDLTLDGSSYNSLKEKTVNNPDFAGFLKSKYSSGSGFISSMASDLDEFNTEEQWKQIVQVLMFNIPENVIDYNNENYMNEFVDTVALNFGYIEDDSDLDESVVASGLAKDGGRYKKIDLYVDGKYYASTNSYKTVRDAVNALKSKDEFKDKKVKGNFAK